MDFSSCKHWGVLVRPGETVKCDPGDVYCHVSQIALQDDKGNEDVRVFVKVGGNEVLVGTLSVDKYPQCMTGLVFKKEFELRHTSKTSNISVLGYKFCEKKSYSNANADEDDDSNEEVPLAIPLYPNTDDDRGKPTKSGVDNPASTQFCKPKNTLKETKDPEKRKVDVGGTDDNCNNENSVDSEEGESGDDENSSDKEDSDSSDEDGGEDTPKNIMAKNTPETPLKTPLKKAKITTPSMGNKTGIGSTKRSGCVHVATPYPKQVKNRPSIIESSKQSAGYSCKSCSKTFYSSVALDTHCKVKHSTHK